MLRNAVGVEVSNFLEKQHYNVCNGLNVISVIPEKMLSYT